MLTTLFNADTCSSSAAAEGNISYNVTQLLKWDSQHIFVLLLHVSAVVK